MMVIVWPTTPSVDSLTRTRIAIAIFSAVAAASIGYYTYQAHQDGPTGSGLHRSNAVRRTRRGTETWASSPSDEPGEDNTDAVESQQRSGDERLLTEGEVGGVDSTQGWWTGASDAQPTQRAGHNIVNLLFRVSEDNARRNGCVHRGCQCNSCGMVPIRGVRYRCANCADFDLCETCEAQGVHTKTHIFYKIKVPAPPFGPRQMQPVWYSGDPDSCRPNLPKEVIATLSRETGFERPELEAFWEQWTYMASTEWRDDPDKLRVAMDRKTFERCLVPTGGSRHAAPNLIHDRMFSFYDSNNDDLISFSEFLHGLSYRKRRDKLKKVFQGYDIDGDGLVDRRDFLRMFRAYYVLYKQMHKDILNGLEDQLLASPEAHQLVLSRQPLSSLFGREGRIPPGDGSLRFEGKTPRRDGSAEIIDGHASTFTESRADVASREDILASMFAYEPESRALTFLRNPDATNWRTMRRASASASASGPYWSALLEPPTSLEAMEALLNRDPEESTVDTSEDEEFDELEDSDEADLIRSGRSYSEHRAVAAAKSRAQARKLENNRRKMARKHLHERWKRRQFYLDEEEGGVAPEDWEDDQDILVKLDNMVGDGSKRTEPAPSTTRSRSSSKVRFVEDADDYEVRSNPSTSSRSVPERWGGMEIPVAERDVGKEILYQVTQEAFNQLLDTIFKKAEDLAIKAAETAEDRQKYKAQIDAIDLSEPFSEEANAETLTPEANALLEDRFRTPRLAETLIPGADALSEDQIRTLPRPLSDEAVEEMAEMYIENVIAKTLPQKVDTDARDPTLPQFRPNTVTEAEASGSGKVKPDPDEAMLRYWKQLNVAESQAKDRGGWGRLNLGEFEAMYKSQEEVGNRLDYLGSWIDFCIP